MRAVLLMVVAALVIAGTAVAQEPPRVDPNPCIGPDAAQFRCPDLVMRRPWGLDLDRTTKRGRRLLRAGNVIDSLGAGPVELHGVRSGRRFMRARQRIYKRDGTRVSVRTGARLQFKFAHLLSYWWKYYLAARFELWRVDARGRRTVKVRTGPKVAYCLRDLLHTHPRRRGSPRTFRYPACSTDSRRRRVTLGISVGWADGYPPSYPEQWIDVTGLRGCFAYVHMADPKNGIFESNEDNNEAQVIVRLPFRPNARRQRCRGRDRGERFVGWPYP